MIKLNIDLIFKKNKQVLNVDEEHPIGSLYLTEENENPSIKKGGTWIKLTDTFLYGVSSGVGETGGSNSEILSIDKIPNHDHTLISVAISGRTPGYRGWEASSTMHGPDAGTYRATGETSKTGGGQAHNNMPYYRKIYVYKRTA